MKSWLLKFLVVLCFSSAAQDFSKMLQSRMWYMSGDLHRGELCTFFPEKPEDCSAYVNFSDREIDIYLVFSEARTGYFYELNENLLKVSYFIRLNGEEKGHDVTVWFRLREIPFSGCIEARPVTGLPGR